jgi:hypothetical protein
VLLHAISIALGVLLCNGVDSDNSRESDLGELFTEVCRVFEPEGYGALDPSSHLKYAVSIFRNSLVSCVMVFCYQRGIARLRIFKV